MFEFWKRATVAGQSSTAPTRPNRFILVAGMLLIVAVQISAGMMIYKSRHAAIASKERELINITTIVSDQLNRVFDAVMAVKLNLIVQFRAREFTSSADFEQRQSNQDTHLRLKNYTNNLPQIGSVALINSQGKLFNSSRAWPAQEEDVSNSDYVTALRTDPHISSILSHPTRSRTGNTWIVHIAHKISSPSGELIGIVDAAIELQYISKLFERVSLGPDTSIANYLMDGTLLARHPYIEPAIGRIASPNMSFMKLLANSNHGSARIMGVFDAKERIIAAHRVGDYQLAVTATETTDSALIEWRRTTTYVIAIVILITLIIAAVVFLSNRQIGNYEFILRERAKVHENKIVGEQKQQLDAALDHMSQGLSMFDAEQRLVLCNKRYAEMYRFTPEQVKHGTTLSQIAEYHIAGGNFSGDSVEKYRAKMQAAANERIAASRNNSGQPAGAANARSTLWSRFESEIKDGRIIAIVNYPTPDGGWVATHEDITSYQKLNNERDRSLTLMAEIVENIPIAIFVKDAISFHYLLFNRAGERWYQVPRDKVIGANAHKLLSKEDADRVAVQDHEFMASADKASTIEHRVRTQHGDEKVISLKRIKIGGKSGQVEYILGILEDLTGRQDAKIGHTSQNAVSERVVHSS